MGAPVPEVESVELPETVAYLYGVYRDLKFARTVADDGFLLVPRDVLKYSEIDAYNRISGLDLQAWEVAAILNLDAVFESNRG